MPRGTPVRWWWLGCLCGVIGTVVVSMDTVADQPNIIVIYTDDQGIGDVSCLNPDAKFKTPNLDRLATEGIRFTNGHSSDTVCTPSRYGLLTGRYCWRTRRKAGVLGAESKCLITPDRVTLASFLKSNGYATAMIGKWHLGMDFPGEKDSRDWSQPVRDMPLDKGFDYFFGVPASLNYGVLAWFEGRYAAVPPTQFTAKKPNRRHVDYRIQPPYQTTPQATREQLGKSGMEVAPDFIDNQCLTRFTDKALAWMNGKAADSKNGQPFFVYLALTSPHYPVCPLPKYWGQGECGGYGEFVIETDDHVGRVLEFLKSSGLDENTLVVFTSDNGPEKSWQRRVTEFDHRSNGRYRGGKRDIYEGGHRVPLLVRWPAGIEQPGRENDALIGQTDLLATVAELIGAEIPAGVGEDSQSFADILLDPAAKHQRVPLINHAANGRFAITEGDWKLIMPHENLPRELYDLRNDPGESENVLAEHPKLASSLESKISRIVCNGRSNEGPRQANDTGHWKDLTWLTPDQYDQFANRTEPRE